MPKLNFIFWGTPDVARETLEILKKNGYLPSLIVTSPDTKSGRGLKMKESPVAIFALQNNIPCLKPENQAELLSIFSNDELVATRGSEKKLKEALSGHDLSIVVAYGKILPENILNIPRFGSINIHYSLLPKYRGASPVESAILNGDTETGVSIQKMVYEMDAGDIITQEKVEIFPKETTPELRARLISLGGKMLVKVLTPTLLPLSKGEVPKAEGVFKLTPQNERKATYCKKIKKEDGLLDLNDDPTKNYNKFRAYAKWPRTFFFENGKRMVITDAILENNQFIIKKVIPEGKKEIDYKN